MTRLLFSALVLSFVCHLIEIKSFMLIEPVKILTWSPLKTCNSGYVPVYVRVKVSNTWFWAFFVLNILRKKWMCSMISNNYEQMFWLKSVTFYPKDWKNTVENHFEGLSLVDWKRESTLKSYFQSYISWNHSCFQ